ncbi:MAG: alpha/beta fold hydrolase [Actinomycetota bacterium]
MAYAERPDGCRIYFERNGSPSAPPVMLLQGYGGDIPGWGATIDHLSTDLHVAAFDFRGSGRSFADSGPVSLATFVDDTLAVLDAAGIDRAHLYGQSFGGMVAQEVALRHPRRARSLILAATHCGGPKRRLGRIRVPKDKPYLALFSEAFAEEHPDRIEDHRRVVGRSPQPLEAARFQYDAMQGFDACDRLRALRVPALILHGTADRLIPAANARMLADLIPGSRLALLEGAGHLYQWEQPEESSRLVVEFIRDVEGGTAA